MKNKIELIVSAVDQTADTWRQATERAKGFGARIQDLSAKTRSFWQQSVRSADDFKLKLDEIDGLLKNLATTAVLYGIVRGAKEAIDTYEQVQNTLMGLASVARYSGVAIGDAMQAAADLSADGLMDVAAASKALQNMLQRGYSLDQSIAMLERLKDSAAFNRAGHLSLAEAVKTATEGLKNENSILVDNAGVTKNVSVMWKEYADQIGKGVNQLSLAEKRQAEFNGIMRETEAQIGNAKRAADGLTGAKARLSVETKTLKQGLGEGLVPAFMLVVSAAGAALNGIKAFIGGIEILTVKVAALYDKAKIGPSRADEITKYEQLIAQAETNRDGWRGNLLGRDTYQVEIDRYKRALAEVKSRAGTDPVEQINAAADAQIQAIIDRWNGVLKAPDIGADTGKRRTDAATEFSSGEETVLKTASSEKDAAKAVIDTARGVTDNWRIQYENRYEIQSRALANEVQAEEDAAKAAIESARGVTDNWQIQHADRYDVQSRALDAMIEAEEQASDTLIELSQRTAESMEQNFSNFYFDVLERKITSLADLWTSLGQTINRVIADYMGQLTRSALFGEKGGGQGLIQAGLSWFTGLFNAHGNVFQSADGLQPYRNRIVSNPTLFRFAHGVGMMGEAGDEAIVPLKRMASGDLGVGAMQPAVKLDFQVINTFSEAKVTPKINSDGTSITVLIEQIENAIVNRTKIQSAFWNAADARYMRQR